MLLPKPLYILYFSACAYGDAYAGEIDISISGSKAEAEAFDADAPSASASASSTSSSSSSSSSSNLSSSSKYQVRLERGRDAPRSIQQLANDPPTDPGLEQSRVVSNASAVGQHHCQERRSHTKQPTVLERRAALPGSCRCASIPTRAPRRCSPMRLAARQSVVHRAPHRGSDDRTWTQGADVARIAVSRRQWCPHAKPRMPPAGREVRNPASIASASRLTRSLGSARSTQWSIPVCIPRVQAVLLGAATVRTRVLAGSDVEPTAGACHVVLSREERGHEPVWRCGGSCAPSTQRTIGATNSAASILYVILIQLEELAATWT